MFMRKTILFVITIASISLTASEDLPTAQLQPELQTRNISNKLLQYSKGVGMSLAGVASLLFGIASLDSTELPGFLIVPSLAMIALGIESIHGTYNFKENCTITIEQDKKILEQLN